MAASVSVYDFLSEESSVRWKVLLQPALRKIQKQVHPRLEIDDEAVAYLEELIYRLLAQMCAAQPHTMADIEAYVQQNFAAPIDTWALSDAKLMMERLEKHAKRKGVFVFNVEKIFQQLQKEVFGYRIELNLIQYIMAILDYVSADILKLAGNFVKNTRRPAVYIAPPDIKVSMAADPALQALFQPLQQNQSLVKEIMSHSLNEEPLTERRSLSYDELLRELMDGEAEYIRHLSLILKVFKEPFLKRPDLFVDIDVQQIFSNLQELHELSVQLLGSLDECIEMAAELGGKGRCPHAGFVFEELAESEEFAVYSTYTGNYMDAIMILEDLLTDPDVVQYFKSLEPKLFKEAMQYILPKSLLEPIYHCFYYFEVMNALMQSSPSDEDQEALESALTCMLALKVEMERECARFLPKRKEDSGIFGRRSGYRVSHMKVSQLQQKIEGWEGPDLISSCTKFIMEGSLGMIREGRARSTKTDRHVFLTDGVAICCKLKRGAVAEYRFKERINMRKAKLIDMEESDDLKFAFQLVEPNQPGIIFYTISKLDKNEWMAALTQLLTMSTFDRMLDSKLREEEATIPVLRPSPEQYRFAEEDSDDNVMYDDPEDGRGPANGPGALIKAGTIYKLVERLTYHEHTNPTFIRIYLMTYRSFSKPSELLNLLIDRFHIPNPCEVESNESRRDPLMMKALKRFKANYVSPIQLRVFNVLRHWVEFHYYDFQREPELLVKLKQFVDSVKTKNMQKWVASIHRALQKKEDEAQPSAAKPVFNQQPQPVEWHLTKNVEEYHILSLHPREFARQLTLILSEYFRAIHPSELVDASWMKEERKEKASPNLLRLNRFETTVANWLAMEIVFMENFEERVALVTRLVEIMEALRDLNSFAGMFIINAAFESASVHRLKHTFKEVAKRDGKKQQVLDEIKLVASSDRGFKNYKERLRAINPPCVPFLGMYMSWIVFIKEGNENKIPGKPDHFINFKKRRKIASVLQEIQTYQSTPYCLTPEPSIQEYIRSQDPIGHMTSNQWEEYIFDQSRSIEPRDQPKKVAPRRFKWDLRSPDLKQGWLNTVVRRKSHHPGVTQVFDGQQDDGTLSVDSTSLRAHKDSTSSIGSGPSSPTSVMSPQTNGLESPDKRMLERDRAFSTPPLLPPRPRRLTPNNSLADMPPGSSVPAIPERDPPDLPPRSNTSSSSSITTSTFPRQGGYRKNPPPAPPLSPPPHTNDYAPFTVPPPRPGPPLPPRPVNDMGPPLPPRTVPALRPRSRPEHPPPPPLPPKGTR